MEHEFYILLILSDLLRFMWNIKRP